MGPRHRLFRRHHLQSALAVAALLVVLSGCGGSRNYTPPPIILTVSISSPTITVSQGGMTYVPVTIQAPTESATFSIIGLPGGVAASYKESESNPSGLLTVMASTQAMIGSYKPTITVGSSGQTASLVFTLVVVTPNKANDRSETDRVDPALNR